MMKFMTKPYTIVGIGVGIGVITCVVKGLQKQNKHEVIETENNKVSRNLKIPKGFVGHVLGRGGSTIKSIREKTGARITFDDSDNEFTVATIRGTPEAVDEAAVLINEILSNRHACVTKEIFLQDNNITESVWKNVNCIRQICDLTRAKIVFDFLPSRGKESQVKITLKGKKEEVAAAVELIDELVAEVEVNTSKPTHVAGRALPENLPLPTSTFGIRNLPCEKLTPSSSDGYSEVFVSSVETPSKFWVQISGTKSIQLDKLATEMTEFYKDEKNRERFQLHSISSGDIVAAFYEGDSSWYRAQVLNVSDEDNSEKKISVFYLDFGDCASLSSNVVCVLKPDFMSIPFQAIECSLGDVAPAHEVWSPEAIDDFEKMVYVAQWKIIMAKPCPRPYQNGEESVHDSIQLVQLLDTNTNKDLNISEELVIKNFARFIP